MTTHDSTIRPNTIYPHWKYCSDAFPKSVVVQGVRYNQELHIERPSWFSSGLPLRDRNGFIYLRAPTELDRRKNIAAAFGAVALVAAAAAVAFMALNFPVVFMGGALLTCAVALVGTVGSLHCCAGRMPNPHTLGYQPLNTFSSDGSDSSSDEEDAIGQAPANLTDSRTNSDSETPPSPPPPAPPPPHQSAPAHPSVLGPRPASTLIRVSRQESVVLAKSRQFLQELEKLTEESRKVTDNTFFENGQTVRQKLSQIAGEVAVHANQIRLALSSKHQLKAINCLNVNGECKQIEQEHGPYCRPEATTTEFLAKIARLKTLVNLLAGYESDCRAS